MSLKYAPTLSPLIWILMCLVGMKGLFDTAWLVSNLILGVGIIPVAIWLSRRFADRIQGFPLARSVARNLAGYNLAAAEACLASLEEFGREESS